MDYRVALKTLNEQAYRACMGEISHLMHSHLHLSDSDFDDAVCAMVNRYGRTMVKQVCDEYENTLPKFVMPYRPRGLPPLF